MTMIRQRAYRSFASALAIAACSISLTGNASAQAKPASGASDSNTGEIEEIIVTAQKRAQSLADVGMSITATTGDALVARGVVGPEDLVKVVPSLTVTKTNYDIPIYTLRGVGFFDSSLSATSTVSMYVDQIPLPYPIMARGASLDLERVEVLKGPQGTVFGQNSTGGLVNYIAAKPTSTLAAGANVSYSRFGLFEGDAFVSGPLSDQVLVRVAGATSQGGDWQESATRPSDHHGAQRFSRGRLQLDVQPTETLRIAFSLSGWIDQSDTQAAQTLDDVNTQNGEPISAAVIASRAAQQARGEVPRMADWNPGEEFRRDDWFIQPALRVDLELGSSLTLTSLTEYSYFKRDSVNDGDGTSGDNQIITMKGSIDNFSQELRLSGVSFNDRLNWTIGANYQADDIVDIDVFHLNADAGGFLLPGLGSFVDGNTETASKITTYAAYASADFDITPNLTLTGGLRYTQTKNRSRACTSDSGDGDLAGIFQILQEFVLNVPVTAAPGECVTLRTDSATPPSQLLTTGSLVDTLKEDNISWRAGLNWKPFNSAALLYGNVSRGYKSGSFPLTPANITSQLEPVKQESLTAYEVGFKAPFANRTIDVSGAAFYYDYSDKQFRGRVPTLFGQLEQLLNIPRSRIWGLELQGLFRPTRGLAINLTGTYVNSRILANSDGTDFVTYPSRPHDDAAPVPLTGEAFPFTPKYSATADVQYDWAVGENFEAFVGGSVNYQSRTKSQLTAADPGRPVDISPSSTTSFNDPVFSMNAYTLLDLRAGIYSKDETWKLTIWARNITNKYYTSSILRAQDTITRYTGMPATYGVTLGWKM